MTFYLWHSQDLTDGLMGVLYMQRHKIQPTLNGAPLHCWTNVGSADGRIVLYTQCTEDPAPPPGQDDWELAARAEEFACLVSTGEGLTEAGREFARQRNLPETLESVVNLAYDARNGTPPPSPPTPGPGCKPF